MSVPPESRPPLRPLHQSSYVDSLTMRALIRTARRNTETEAPTRVWHEGLQKLRLFSLKKMYAVISEDEG